LLGQDQTQRLESYKNGRSSIWAALWTEGRWYGFSRIFGVGLLSSCGSTCWHLGYHNHNTKKAASEKNFVAQVNRVSEGSGNKWSDIVHCYTHTHTHILTHSHIQTMELRLRLRRSLGDWKAVGGRGQTNGKLKRATRSIVIGSRCNNTYIIYIHIHIHIVPHKLICDIKIVK